MEPPASLSSIDVIAATLDPGLPMLADVSSPDGALTLMLSDIANAAHEQARLGEERWRRVLEDHRRLVGRLVAHHDGRVVQEQEDGFMATFASAHAGLHAAIELSQTFGGGEDASGLAVRAGLHSGFVLGNSDQLLGRNVVLAARIAALAKPGDILVSAAVRQYTSTDPRFEFEPRGQHHFKGMLGEHEVYAVRSR